MREQLAHNNVAFISDYGIASHVPACVRAVISSCAGGVEINDVTHGVPPRDKRYGAYVLCDVAPSLEAGVVLAVVDGQVDRSLGTTSRAIAVSVGKGESIVVGPDNGLLAPLVAMVGGADAAVVIDDQRAHQALGTNGIELFAPAVGKLCKTGRLEDVGECVDPNELTPGVLSFGVAKGGVVETGVIFIDGFGNVVLDCDAALVGDVPSVSVECADSRVVAASGASGVAAGDSSTAGNHSPMRYYVNHLGLVCLTLHGHSAAEKLGCEVGAQVRIRKQLI